MLRGVRRRRWPPPREDATASSKGYSASRAGAFARRITAGFVSLDWFFLLSKRNANNPSVDLAQWKATYDARIANQKETFLGAVREMIRLVLADIAAPREAQVGQCYYADVEIFGIPVAPNEGTYAFRDLGAIEANTACWGPQRCADNRVTWIRRVTDEVKRRGLRSRARRRTFTT